MNRVLLVIALLALCCLACGNLYPGSVPNRQSCPAGTRYVCQTVTTEGQTYRLCWCT